MGTSCSINELKGFEARIFNVRKWASSSRRFYGCSQYLLLNATVVFYLSANRLTDSLTVIFISFSRSQPVGNSAFDLGSTIAQGKYSFSASVIGCSFPY